MSDFAVFNLNGVVDRFRALAARTSQRLRLTSQGSIGSADVEPFRFEPARAGCVYVASPGVIGNALGALQTLADVPTTAAGNILYNKSTDPTMCLAILAVFAHQSSGTPAVNTGLLVSTPGAVGTAPTANATGGVIASASGSSRASNAWISTGQTFSTAQAWMDVAGNQQSATAGVGSSLVAWLDGAIVVRPGQAVGTNMLSGIGTNHKWGIGFVWAEFQTDIE